MAFRDIFRRKKINNMASTANENYILDILRKANLNGESSQLKLSAVYRCIDIRSNSIGKLPFFIVDTRSHQRSDDPRSLRLKYLLNVRPNQNMNAFVYHKLMEMNVLMTGNAYALIESSAAGKIISLTPINSDRIKPEQLDTGEVVYKYSDKEGKRHTLFQDEVIHILGMSYDGIIGESVLTYARKVTDSALLQEEYQRNFYERGGRPSGTLKTATDLGKVARGADGKPDLTGKSARDIIRAEWEKATAGVSNVNRVAVLDNGFEYSAVPQISQKDMAFIESKEVTIADIARFFGVPLYKLFAGKESYQSNEMNGIAYVTDTLVPPVTQYEQEYTYKGLTEEQQIAGVSVKANLNAEMRGDLKTRSEWYKAMHDTGVYSVNDIRDFEDMESVDGGDVRIASLNYVPLELFKELSIKRNAGQTNAVTANLTARIKNEYSLTPDPDEGVEHNPESEEDCRARARRLGFPQSQCIQADTGDKGWYIAPNGITAQAAKKTYANSRAGGDDKETAAKKAWAVQKNIEEN